MKDIYEHVESQDFFLVLLYFSAPVVLKGLYTLCQNCTFCSFQNEQSKNGQTVCTLWSCFDKRHMKFVVSFPLNTAQDGRSAAPTG